MGEWGFLASRKWPVRTCGNTVAHVWNALDALADGPCRACGKPFPALGERPSHLRGGLLRVGGVVAALAGSFSPGRGSCRRTCGELLSQLREALTALAVSPCHMCGVSLTRMVWAISDRRDARLARMLFSGKSQMPSPHLRRGFIAVSEWRLCDRRRLWILWYPASGTLATSSGCTCTQASVHSCPALDALATKPRCTCTQAWAHLQPRLVTSATSLDYTCNQLSVHLQPALIRMGPALRPLGPSPGPRGTSLGTTWSQPWSAWD